MLDPGKIAPKVPVRPYVLKPKPAHKTYTSASADFSSERQFSSLDDSDIGPRHPHSISRSQSDLHPAPSSHNSQPFEQVALYKSYARESGRPEVPYEAHVRGWLYHPQLNRKGKLMIAAVEKLVGNPGKYSSIADAAAAHVAESQPSTPSSTNSHNLIDISEHSPTGSPSGMNSNDTGILSHSPHSSSWLNFARPPMFRSRSSKSAVKTTKSKPVSPSGTRTTPSSPSLSAQTSAVNSAVNSTTNSAVNSTVNSAANSANNSAENSAVNSPDHSVTNSAASSAANTAPNSPVAGPSLVVSPVPDDGLALPKRPGMRRTATFTFDPHSNPKGKVYSASHLARKEQKHTIRERMAAISHKSLAMRDVQIVVESEPDSRGHRKKRTFWAYTDESGRFGQSCCVPYKPVIVRVSAGLAREVIPLIFVPTKGISIISDIDDTVRHTGVTKSKRELLQNVLAKSFDECRVDGVAEWYKKMAEAGAHFHYVSNSPWQLYDVIHGFLNHHKFPEGSIHLKKYAGVFDGLTEPAKGRKRATLDRILKDFPNHKFILVGDSGEADLEAYGEVAQKYPDQVLAIYIRDITLSPDEPLSVYDKKPNNSQHRRYHSVELISLDKGESPSSKTATAASSSKPPRLPPRVRPEFTSNATAAALNNMSLNNISLNEDEPTSPSGSSAEPTDSSIPSPTPPGRKPVPDSLVFPPASEFTGQSPIGSPMTEALSQPSSEQSSIGGSSRDRTRDSTREPSQEPPTASPSLEDVRTADSDRPKPPPHPKLIRRTSSRIMEGVYSMASASSHAAARFLGPQLPPRPGSKLPSSKEVSPSPGGHPPRLPSRPTLSRKNSAQDNHSYFGNHSAYSPDPYADHTGYQDHPPGFVPSSQDIVDFDKVGGGDKRGESWRARVSKQNRILPNSVRLKMWRHPGDIETESLRLIKGDEESLL